MAASRRDRLAWRAEFKEAGADRVRAMVHGGIYRGDKLRVARRWLARHDNRYVRIGLWIAAAGVAAAVGVALLR